MGDSSSGDGFERERTVAFIAPTQRAADVSVVLCVGCGYSVLSADLGQVRGLFDD